MAIIATNANAVTRGVDRWSGSHTTKDKVFQNLLAEFDLHDATVHASLPTAFTHYRVEVVTNRLPGVTSALTTRLILLHLFQLRAYRSS